MLQCSLACAIQPTIRAMRQRQFASRGSAAMDQHRQRIVDIHELAGRFRDPLGTSRVNLRGAPARVSASNSDIARDLRACRRHGQSPRSVRRARRAPGSRANIIVDQL